MWMAGLCFVAVLLFGCSGRRSVEETPDGEIFTAADARSSEDPAAQAAAGGDVGGGKEKDPEHGDGAKTDEKKETSQVSVYVCGAVAQPGVYRFAAGARIDEGVRAAGGFASDAAQSAVNLARIMEDGQQIYVPTQAEIEKGGALPGGAGAAFDGQEGGSGAEERVNVNTDSIERLMMLPGIGRIKAQAIICHREQEGAFLGAEDLLAVEGIGQGTLDKIRDHITF